MSANEGVTKAIASFYQGDSDTAFLDLSYYYTCQLFQSQMREIFTLSWPGLSGNVLPTYEDFRRLSEDVRTLPKMSADLPKAFEHFRSYLRWHRNYTRAFCCDKFSVITFWFLTRWLRNFAKNNRYHSAITRNITISLMVNISWEIGA